MHNVGSASDRGCGEAPSYDFAEACNIGAYAEKLLCSTGGNAKAGYHFVKYQNSIVIIT
jgi:hypothetical protein